MSPSTRCALPFLLLSLSAPAWADFDACRDQFPNRTPPKVGQSPGQTRDLCMSGFAILHSGESKTAVFVVEKLNRARLIDAQDEERTDKFYEEARLPDRERAQLSDYRGSGYDRGHMAPAADMPNPNAMAQSFSLANMVPQAHEMNRGIWARSVEEATRKYVMRAKGEVFVFTGPVFHRQFLTIGPRRVWVPKYLYKLVYDAAVNCAWAHWVENRDEARMGKPISYEALVKRTGIEFLPGIRPAACGGAQAGAANPEPARPVQTTPAPRATAGVAGARCGDKRTTCKQMTSCAEAKHYLTVCGVRSLDRNGDGVPCETLCR